jgi:hypothetical protein
MRKAGAVDVLRQLWGSWADGATEAWASKALYYLDGHPQYWRPGVSHGAFCLRSEAMVSFCQFLCGVILAYMSSWFKLKNALPKLFGIQISR